MLNTLKLLLPALLPSWRFFDFIAPSPRIQFALLRSENEVPNDWMLFRPRPTYLSFTQMLGRMVWNPVWNESLFMVSCAERIIEQPTQHSEDEILKRIRFELAADMLGDMKYIQFRLITVQRVEKELVEEIVFQSRLEPIVR